MGLEVGRNLDIAGSARGPLILSLLLMLLPDQIPTPYGGVDGDILTTGYQFHKHMLLGKRSKKLDSLC